jgi:hypothetical protein
MASDKCCVTRNTHLGGNMARKSATLALLSNENHERVLVDLGIFFGLRSEAYIKIFEEMRPKPGVASSSRSSFPRSWSWPTFLLSFVWFFYRKMYLIGAIAILVPVVLSLLLPGAGSAGAYAGLALAAKPMYVQSALGRIAKADALGLSGRERAEYLKRGGGVSWPAGVAAGVLYALFLALAIYAAVMKGQSGATG